MNVMTIAIGASVICLVLVGIGMITISNKKRAEEKEKIAREAAYKKAMEASKAKEHQERVYKAETGHIPTQLFLPKKPNWVIQEKLYTGMSVQQMQTTKSRCTAWFACVTALVIIT